MSPRGRWPVVRGAGRLPGDRGRRVRRPRPPRRRRRGRAPPASGRHSTAAAAARAARGVPAELVGLHLQSSRTIPARSRALAAGSAPAGQSARGAARGSASPCADAGSRRPRASPCPATRASRRAGAATATLAAQAAPVGRRARDVALAPGPAGRRGATTCRSGSTASPGSIAFVADGAARCALGLTRQLVGDPAFGARGFRYCGSLLGPAGLLPARGALLDARARRWRRAVTAELRAGGPQRHRLHRPRRRALADRGESRDPAPRWSWSSAPAARPLFELHARGLRAAAAAAHAARAPAGVVGKAIVFARRGVACRRSPRPARSDVADVPHAGRADRPGTSDLHRVRRGPRREQRVSARSPRGPRRLRAVEPAARGAA